MIKGFSLTFIPNQRMLVWRATKPTTLSLRSCAGVYIGDNTITISSGYKIKSQEITTVNLATNDELYAIFDSACRMTVLVQA